MIESSPRTWKVRLSGSAEWFEFFVLVLIPLATAAAGFEAASKEWPSLNCVPFLPGRGALLGLFLGLLAFVASVVHRWLAGIAKKESDRKAKSTADALADAESRCEARIEEHLSSFREDLTLIEEETISAVLSAIALSVYGAPDKGKQSNRPGQLFRLTYHRLAGNDGALIQTVDYVGNDNCRTGKGRTIPARMGVTGRAFATRAAVWESLTNEKTFDQVLTEQGFDEATRASVQQDRRFWAAVPVFIGNLDEFCGVVYCDSNDADFLKDSETSLRVRYLKFAAIILAKYEATTYEWSISEQ